MSIYRRAFSMEDRRLAIISTGSFEIRVRVSFQVLAWMQKLSRGSEVLFREQDQP